jgi:epoxyqueuosine reductase
VPGAASAKSIIKDVAHELGIDGIGICDSEPIEATGEAIQAAASRGLIPAHEVPGPRTLARLIAPREHLKGARSVVTAYESYYKDVPAETDPRRGTIAPYTRANYYKDLKLRLGSLAQFMRKRFGCRTKAFSCYVTLAEKPLARRAGLGFYGKHGIIITPQHGSCVVLGEIITDLELEPDEPIETSCGDCSLCMEACPTGALEVPYLVNKHACIQYLSERRCMIPLKTREIWENRLYGCSTCQDVCPHNRDLKPTPREVPHGHVGPSLALGEVLMMDESRFKERFGDNQIGMRDRNAIRRNAIVAIGNSSVDDFVRDLEACAHEPDPMIKQHSYWAIARTGGPASRSFLERALDAEPIPSISVEIKTLLDGLGGIA